jgi:hypothetical protein
LKRWSRLTFSVELVESGGRKYLLDSSGWKDVTPPALVERECIEIFHPLSCLFGIGCRYE